MTTGSRMKARRKEIGVSVDEIAAALNVSIATVYRYENGEIEKVPGAVLEPLAKVLRTTPAYLMGWDSEVPSNNLPSNIISVPEMREVPLVGTIACGSPIMAVENFSEKVSMPSHINADFALRCKGDSMLGSKVRIHDGDIVYIRQQDDVDSGAIAAVLIEDEATLKRVYKKPDRLILQPENPDYEPLVYTGEELNMVRILGKAVAFLSQEI